MKHFFTLIFLSFALFASAEDEAFVQGEGWSLQGAITKAVNGTDTVSRWKQATWVTVPKFGGYIVGSYKYDSKYYFA